MITRFAKQTVLEYLEIFPATGLIGPRQVGKTTLARQIEREYLAKGIHALYLDMELPEDEAKLREPVLFLEPLKETLVIIDEVQRMPSLFPILRSLIDRWRYPGRFLLLGSAAPTIRTASSESLAGRIGYCELSPLLLHEMLPESTANGLVFLHQHWSRGGFPQSMLATTDKRSLTWRREFLRSYTERDLPMLGISADPKLTRTFLSMIAHYHGQVWNSQTFASSLGVSAPTVNRYARFLEDSFLISFLRPFAQNAKKRLVKSPKVYVRDSGLATALLGIASWEALSGHPQLGALWEGYVIEQIRGSLGEGEEMMFYRTHEGAECDVLICADGMPKYAVEIKYTSAPKVSKGLRNVIADLQTVENFIVIPQGTSYQASENIFVVSLEQFIKVRRVQKL